MIANHCIPPRLLSTALALAVLAALTACWEQDPPEPIEPASNGFVMEANAFSFPNYAGPSPGSAVNTELMARMFEPTAVCAEIEDGGKCRLSLIAKAWMKNVNESMKGGRCEGFAVLSSLLYSGFLNPQDFGAATAADLEIDGNEKLAREIAYWFATQYLQDVVRSQTTSMSAREAALFLSKEFSKPGEEREDYRVGIVRIDESGRIAGGHAVLPYAIERGDGEDQFLLKVYDNNHPGLDRAILIDAEEDRWEYQASTDPSRADALYVGDAQNHNRLYLAPIRPRVGKHPCTFCTVPEAEGQQILAQVFGTGSLNYVVSDDQGAKSGIVDGRFVNGIAGAVVAPVFSEDAFADTPLPDVLLPKDVGDVTVELRGNGEAGPAAVVMVRPGAVAAVETEYTAGQYTQNALQVSADGRAISYRRLSASGATVSLVSESTSGKQVSVSLGFSEDVEVGQVPIAIDAETGNATLKAESPQSVPLQIEVTRSTSDSEEVLEGEVLAPPEGGVTLVVEDWGGEGEVMPAIFDTNGDGLPDLITQVTDIGVVGEPPAAPDGLVATAATHQEIRLSWNDHSTNEERFLVERTTDGASFVQVAEVAVNATAWSDTTVVHSETYRYRVRASGQYGQSDWSQEAEATTPGCPAGTQDFDDDKVCAEACGAASCSGHGTCDDASGAIACVCEVGYVGDACESCDVGYERVGTECRDVDECATGNGGCATGSTCVNHEGGRLCVCPTCDAPATSCQAATGTCDDQTGLCSYSALAAGTACADDGNGCTVDRCDGAGACTHAPAPVGTLCRAAAGPCDVEETCDGSDAPCPGDALESAGVVCRPSAGDCDVAESCTGSSVDCPADGFASAATVCRAEAGPCDVAESCTGSTATCPADGLQPASYECRAAAGVCDLAEVCDGASAACPSDRVRGTAEECRPSAGGCDLLETCDGSSVLCPADALAPFGVECRGSTGACDVAETCTGLDAACPADVQCPSGTYCDGANGCVALPPAPANTMLPVIAGTPEAGQTLTTSDGIWANSPTNFTYQWQGCDPAGANCADLVDEYLNVYVVTSSEIGQTLRVVVTASNPGGSTAATSPATALVTGFAPANTVLPTITGTAQQGATLSATTGTWSNGPTAHAYQWRTCDAAGASCADIAGATAADYTLGAGEVGLTLRVVVTASNPAGATSATSLATEVVVP